LPNPKKCCIRFIETKKTQKITNKMPLKFIAYTFGYEKGLKVEKQFDYLKKLAEWGFKIKPF
jgi:DNA ligase (NAD+)